MTGRRLAALASIESGKQRWQQLRQDLGRSLAQKLFDEMQRTQQGAAALDTRRNSRSYVLAVVLAALIHLAAAAFAVAGVAMLLSTWSNVFQVLLGVALLLLAWISRPRFGEPPHYTLQESDYPTLFLVTRRLAEHLKSPAIAGIEASAEFGASYRTVGWRQHRYMSLGAPLMAVLTRQQRLAIIAHELAHGANGDPMRGLFFFGAVNSLVIWADAVRPASIGNSGHGLFLGPLVSTVAIPFELLMLALSELIYAVAKAMVLLVHRDSQRAEYLADLLAAAATGPQAMVGGLERTYLAEEIDAACRRLALTRPTGPLEAELARERDLVSAETLQTYREKSLSELWQVDSTHPPTAMRVAMLSGVPQNEPAVQLSDEEGRRFDDDMSKLIAWRQREVMNRKLEAAYG